MRRLFRLAVAGLLVVTGTAPAHPVLAGSCTAPCLAVGISDNVNVNLPPTADSLSGAESVTGLRSWLFSLSNASGSPVTNASITVNGGYPASDFVPPASLPATASQAVLNPGQELDLNLRSTISTTFSTRFDSSRSVLPLLIPPGGAEQLVTVTATPVDAGTCRINPFGDTECALLGDLQTGLAGAAVVSVTAPANLDQGELFHASSPAPGVATWVLNGPQLGKSYTFTVLLSLPDRDRPYVYKPWLNLDLTDAGPHGCLADPCIDPTSTISIPDATLDGSAPGSGSVTFSADQPSQWDTGGPPSTTGVHYSGVVAKPGRLLAGGGA